MVTGGPGIRSMYARVARATHMIVGDRNDAFTDTVRQFIQPLRDSGPRGLAS